MSDLTLTKTSFHEGVWEGLLTGADGGAPQIRVTHGDRIVDGLDLRRDDDGEFWHVSLPVPPQLLNEGCHTVVFADAQDGEVLETFPIIAGEVLGDDIRVQLELMRAELDVLKRAFRQHCRDAE